MVGTGAREYALTRRLHAEGADVVMSTPHPWRPATAPAGVPLVVSDAAGILAASADRILVVQDERLTASGLVDAAKSRGIPTVGPTLSQSTIEATRRLASGGDVHDRLFPPRRAGVPAQQALADIEAATEGTTFVVRPARATHHPPLVAVPGGAAVSLPASWSSVDIEPLIAGPVFTRYATSDRQGGVAWSPVLVSYPFTGGVAPLKTGGLRCETVTAADHPWWGDIERWLATAVFGADGDWRTFVCVEVVDAGDGPTILDVDGQLGNPETSTILAATDVDLGGALWSLAHRGWCEPIPMHRSAASLAICPPGYPRATTPALGPTGGVQLADIGHHDVTVDVGCYVELDGDTYVAGPGRAGVLTATGRAASNRLLRADDRLPAGLWTHTGENRLRPAQAPSLYDDIERSLASTIDATLPPALVGPARSQLTPWVEAAAVAASSDMGAGGEVALLERMWPGGRAPSAWWLSPTGRLVAAAAPVHPATCVDAATARELLGVSRARLYQLAATGAVEQPMAGRFSVRSVVARLDALAAR